MTVRTTANVAKKWARDPAEGPQKPPRAADTLRVFVAATHPSVAKTPKSK